MKESKSRISKEDLNFLLTASSAAFITYLSMYAFRKPFTAFSGRSIRALRCGKDYRADIFFRKLREQVRASAFHEIERKFLITAPRQAWARGYDAPDLSPGRGH